jgi:hypothetical protein
MVFVHSEQANVRLDHLEQIDGGGQVDNVSRREEARMVENSEMCEQEVSSCGEGTDGETGDFGDYWF